MEKDNLLQRKMSCMAALFGLSGLLSLGLVKADDTGTEEVAFVPCPSSQTQERGALKSQEALVYMKSTPSLVIVDVAAKRWYKQTHFEGAINIPIEELSAEEEKECYRQLPKGRPVLLHCRLRMIVPGAYRTLKELRPDIPEITYIDGKPPFEAYNQWVASQKDKSE